MSRSSSEYSDTDRRFNQATYTAGQTPPCPPRNSYFGGPPYYTAVSTERRPSSPSTADTSSLPDIDTPVTPSIRITHPSQERFPLFIETNGHRTKKMSPSKPAGFTLGPVDSGLDSPMTPPTSSFDVYTPGPLDTPRVYPSGSDTPQPQYGAFTQEKITFRRPSYTDEISIASVPKTRIRTRRFMRKLRQTPSFVRLGLLIGSLGLLALLFSALPRIRSSSGGASMWSDIQRQFARGMGVVELCDP
jgi:hypothetical protein